MCVLTLQRCLSLRRLLLIDCGYKCGKTRGRRTSRRKRWCANPLFCVLPLWWIKVLVFGLYSMWRG